MASRSAPSRDSGGQLRGAPASRRERTAPQSRLLVSAGPDTCAVGGLLPEVWLRRPSCRCKGRGVRGQHEVRQHLSHRREVRQVGYDAPPAPAPGTQQHLLLEGAFEETGPVEPRCACADSTPTRCILPSARALLRSRRDRSGHQKWPELWPGAKTPWKHTGLLLGGGTRAAIRRSSSSPVKRRCVAPSGMGRFMR